MGIDWAADEQPPVILGALPPGFEELRPWQDVTEGDETVFYTGSARWG